jgi:hypothetical protein
MDTYNKIKIIDLRENYKREVFGLGEIYEIMSVERRRKLLGKYTKGTLYLSSNKNHSGLGMTIKELEDFLKSQRKTVLGCGFVDSPPWSSSPRNEENKSSYGKISIIAAKIIFWFLVHLEFFWEGPKKSHMIYLFSKQ